MTAPAVHEPQPPAWLAEIDPAPGPPFLAMGLRGRSPGRRLTTDDQASLALKARILSAHRLDVVVALDGAPDVDAAAIELDRTVQADVARARRAADRPEPRPAHTGPAPDRPGQAPGRAGRHEPAAGRVVEAAARLVAEDLCVLVPRNGTWVLGAACVCFPSHWRPADKLGRPVAEIHAPVPHYASELAARVDRFLDRLTPGRGAWRRNWLVHTDDRLYAPVPAPPPDPPLTAADAGASLWLRSERQTLRRLPGTGAIVFTIRTQQAPLSVVAARPALRALLTAAVASWPADLVAYRGGEAVRTPLLGWLRSAPDAA